MRLWSKIRFRLLHEYAEHKINQGFLWSAVILRKIVDDEKDAEKVSENSALPMPRLPILKIRVKVKHYDHIDEKKFFMVSRFFPQDYDFEKEKEGEEPLNHICNQIIHSYSWSVVYLNRKNIYGIFFASDVFKEKGIFFLTISEWLSVLQEVIDKAAI